ncbi:hypothetical protein TetV_663 [Tetraselmis virus 1]|uniref:Uncharacterized protein n=1 Tax=Tetraselmis virus 1 TaxID=2060617 RepID=A0A2P0VPA0_9VIRU|nr:hypothetical protein QJ968_gp391 [Tetraselmis virus 1]AUF82745.1 hypothetical protein TetV_663 [Tetraselmis virus 1]
MFLPTINQIWGIHNYLNPISSRTHLIRNIYDFNEDSKLAFLKEDVFSINYIIFSKIAVPRDGLCGYHCMSYYRNLSERRYLDLFGPNSESSDVWCDDRSWQMFANHWNITVKMYEYKPLYETPVWNTDSALRTLSFQDFGECNITLIEPVNSKEGTIHVLHYNAHFEPIEPIYKFDRNIL